MESNLDRGKVAFLKKYERSMLLYSDLQPVLSCHTSNLQPIIILCIYHKNEKGKPPKKDLPLSKNNIPNILGH